MRAKPQHYGESHIKRFVDISSSLLVAPGPPLLVT